MKKKLFALLAFIVCITVLLAASAAYADFGDFSGDSDFDIDWGGSDSDWGSSSWDDDDYSGGGGFWIIGDSSDYSEGSGRASCTSGDMMMVFVFIIIIVLILWFISRKAPHAPVITTVQRTDDSMLTPIDQYIANADPAFSVSQMQTKINNLYVQLQDQWCAKDLEPLRPYLTDELYNQSERQLDELRRAHRTPHVERISVLGTDVRGVLQRDGMDHLIVELNTRITTYTTDDETGNIVAGDPGAEKFMTYEWDLCRTAGLVSGSGTVITNCPNCGAPVNINKTAKCPYCDTVITVDEHDWVLYSIKGLTQKTQ